MLIKRFITEAVSEQLKSISQIEHSWHRSNVNFMVKRIAIFIAYTFQPKRSVL
ncbi:transposase [Candidatus Enterovibrio escicola]|uniref:transposase n=1 Tax=Candidatus Enterovibrio escicola TaxID=1927127 RepID=UPI000BE25F13|nr:transposase [Candidatus Enterovibrio escacola]